MGRKACLSQRQLIYFNPFTAVCQITLRLKVTVELQLAQLFFRETFLSGKSQPYI